MTLMTSNPAEARDLDADLAICEAVKDFPIIAVLRSKDGRKHAHFVESAVKGWPYAIRRAQEAEREVDRLRNELDMLQEQLSQHHRSGCYD